MGQGSSKLITIEAAPRKRLVEAIVIDSRTIPYHLEYTCGGD